MSICGEKIIRKYIGIRNKYDYIIVGQKKNKIQLKTLVKNVMWTIYKYNKRNEMTAQKENMDLNIENKSIYHKTIKWL